MKKFFNGKLKTWLKGGFAVLLGLAVLGVQGFAYAPQVAIADNLSATVASDSEGEQSVVAAQQEYVTGQSTVTQKDVVASQEQTEEFVYSIYPVPQEATDLNALLTISKRVRLVMGNIDDSTTQHLYSVLSCLDILVSTTQKSEQGTTVYVGVYNSGDGADTYAKTNCDGYSDLADLFVKTDAYLLQIKGNAIVVLGKDTDAVYYGLTTLGQILKQTKNNTVKCLLIKDYSDCTYRGFIEGFYGIPWTTDERVELMEFGSQFKTNVYIYAPKDDPYHNTNWRGLYSQADLKKIEALVEAGTRTKTRFVWAIHPFMTNALKEANYATDYAELLAKFEQLYAIGVRQFAISADDIEIPEASKNAEGYEAIGALHKKLLNDVSNWVKEKGDCYNLIFVPTAYFSACEVTPADYYKGLTAGLDESVEIMWTGNRVCSKLSNCDFKNFSSLTTGRTPFVWMNWSVTDYAHEYLSLGKGEVFDVGLNGDGTTDFSGIVVNPMEYAESSKISIYAAADYCWNVNGFDSQTSWEKSLAYIEPQAYGALQTICNQLTNAGGFAGVTFAESEDFVDDTQAFLTKWNASEDCTEIGETLIGKFNGLTNSCQTYLESAQNKKLLAELTPWVKSLSILSETCASYIRMALDVRAGKTVTSDDFNAVMMHYAEREELVGYTLAASTYKKMAVTPKVGLAVLQPFYDKLLLAADDEIRVACGAELHSGYGGFNRIHQGVLENLTDGNDDTYVWFDGYPTEGTFVRIDFGEVKKVTNIRIRSGNASDGDIWTGAVVEYSENGVDYQEAGSISGTETILTIPESYVRYIRIRQKSGKSETWVAIKEISIY
jgi:hyaluronoglucosaminidase